MVRTVGLVRVLTTTDQDLLEAHARLIEGHFPDLRVQTRCIPDHPRGVHDAETEALAAAKVLEVAARFAREGVDAVIVSCAADPGVDLCRQHLSLPVIGAGRAAAAAALALGRPAGVLGITPEVPRVVRSLLGDQIRAVAAPEGVATTVDLLTDEGRAAAARAASGLLRRGAEMIVFACTGLSTIGLGPFLRAHLRVPVVDAVLASGTMAWYATLGPSAPGRPGGDPDCRPEA